MTGAGFLTEIGSVSTYDLNPSRLTLIVLGSSETVLVLWLLQHKSSSESSITLLNSYSRYCSKMNENSQTELHYTNTGFPYAATESFMGFFQVPVNYTHTGPLHDHDNSYWSLNMNAYKYGFSSGPESTSYYDHYEVNANSPTMDVTRRAWEYPSVANAQEPTTQVHSEEETTVTDVNTIPEDCISDNPGSTSPQGLWQDDIDPDNMTYEELLDLGEAVGTESRGLSQELISMLPTSKCKFGSFFSRKKSGERSVPYATMKSSAKNRSSAPPEKKKAVRTRRELCEAATKRTAACLGNCSTPITEDQEDKGKKNKAAVTDMRLAEIRLDSNPRCKQVALSSVPR
ncbi:unnamed protein product [Linum tenue]|uniref:Uncharacterized protein n=1 Tax=Linum tenue TaxID=586396 RepID=A0AAV0L9W5_9ROSI|nr:unnamed protein product [Linum tenue]